MSCLEDFGVTGVGVDVFTFVGAGVFKQEPLKSKNVTLLIPAGCLAVDLV